MTVFLSLDDVLYIAERFRAAERDVGLVEAAVARPRASAFGEDAYPSIRDKAAALLHSLAANQAFVDGNKRVAWVATKLFLALNALWVTASADDGERFMVGVTHHSDWQELAAWLGAHASSGAR